MANTSLLGSFGGQDNSALMFRNVLVNGCFRVWQRGTSQTSSGYGSDDRWANSNVGSTKTHSQQAFTVGQTDVPGNPQFFSRTVVSSVAGAGNLVLKQQRIEGVRTLAGQAATISFWAKADAPKQMALSFTQYFGGGGSPSSAVVTHITKVSLTASWQLFTVSTTVPSISGKTIGTDNSDWLALNFWFDAGSTYNADTGSLGQQSGTFDIAMVQMEAGPVATPFERRPIGQELALAQRYCYVQTAATCPAAYKRFALGFAASTNTSCQLVFLPSMRVPPTPTFSAPSTFVLFDGTNITVLNSILVDTSLSEVLHINCGTSGTLAANRPYMLLANNNNTAYIIYSAEL